MQLWSEIAACNVWSENAARFCDVNSCDHHDVMSGPRRCATTPDAHQRCHAGLIPACSCGCEALQIDTRHQAPLCLAILIKQDNACETTPQLQGHRGMSAT